MDFNEKIMYLFVIGLTLTPGWWPVSNYCNVTSRTVPWFSTKMLNNELIDLPSFFLSAMRKSESCKEIIIDMDLLNSQVLDSPALLWSTNEEDFYNSSGIAHVLSMNLLRRSRCMTNFPTTIPHTMAVSHRITFRALNPLGGYFVTTNE